jgi:hypothetical protein
VSNDTAAVVQRCSRRNQACGAFGQPSEVESRGSRSGKASWHRNLQNRRSGSRQMPGCGTAKVPRQRYRPRREKPPKDCNWISITPSDGVIFLSMGGKSWATPRATNICRIITYLLLVTCEWLSAALWRRISWFESKRGSQISRPAKSVLRSTQKGSPLWRKMCEPRLNDGLGAPCEAELSRNWRHNMPGAKTKSTKLDAMTISGPVVS